MSFISSPLYAIHINLYYIIRTPSTYQCVYIYYMHLLLLLVLIVCILKYVLVNMYVGTQYINLHKLLSNHIMYI